MSDQAQEATAAKMQRVAETRCYQLSVEGFFVVAHRDGGHHERGYRLTMLEGVLEGVQAEEADWFIAQASFGSTRRRVMDVIELSLLFCDLDTYRQERLAGLGARELVVELLAVCEREGLPVPSLVVFSGRGLQSKWLLREAIGPAMLGRWAQCQRLLARGLASMGADGQALDAARLLRLVGTRHGESGRLVEVVHGDLEAPLRYTFEELWTLLNARPVADRTQEAPRSPAKARGPSAAMSGAEARRSAPVRRSELPKHEWSWKTELALARFLDLRSVITMRGGIEEGARMRFLFWCLNFFCFTRIVETEEALMREAEALVESIDPTWCFERDALSTLLRKSIEHCNGATVHYNGVDYPPLYTPKNAHLIEQLQITVEEQRELTTILSPQVARERRLAQYAHRHRADGRVPRDEYLSSVTNQELRDRVLSMHRDGMSGRAIASEVGVDRKHVARIIKNNK